jgi:hypothetical protein
MKTIFLRLRVCLGIALLAALAACGGGSVSTYSLGGTVNGLTGSGLQVYDNYETLSIPANATGFTFVTQLPQSTTYNVVVTTQPTNQYCTVGSGSGYMGTANISNVQINCVPLLTVGGTISGLTGSGLVLVNGNDSVTLNANATTFTFPTHVLSGSPYSVQVLTQPTNPTQACTVQNGIAVVGNSNVTNVAVTCQ